MSAVCDLSVWFNNYRITLESIIGKSSISIFTVIVALEQNMLEAEIIQLDLEKILAVILSAAFQVHNFF